jgi:hypothetical protein
MRSIIKILYIRNYKIINTNNYLDFATEENIDSSFVFYSKRLNNFKINYLNENKKQLHKIIELLDVKLNQLLTFHE